MFSVVATGVVLWLAIGFVCAVCMYVLSDRDLGVGDVALASAGLSTAGPLLLFILIAMAVSCVSESPAAWGEE